MTVRLTEAFYRGRGEAVQAALQQEGLDGLLLLNPANVIYVSGFYHIPSERPIGVYVPASGQPVLFAPLLEQENSEESWIGDRRFYFEYPGEEHPIQWMLNEVSAAGTVGVDALPYALAARGVRTAAALTHSNLAERLRWVKTPEELVLIERAAGYADYCLEYLLANLPAMLRDGATELQMLRACIGATAARMAEEVGTMFRLGGAGVVGTIHSGARAALPHGAPLEKRVMPGETIIAGIGAEVGGYHAESGATFVAGDPTADQWRCLRAAAACNDAAIRALRPGAACHTVSTAALDELHAAGLGSYIRHRIGHGMGIEGHEAPWLAPGDDTLLAPGMVFSNEPGIYRPGIDGYRTINTMIVTEGAAHVPSRFLAAHPPEKRVVAI
jgi:Xaa-Pro aminopeptidase